MSAPKWAIGMRRITPGVYVDSKGAMHIDGAEVCIANGHPPTPENIEMLVRVTREMLRGVDVRVEESSSGT